MVWGTADDSPYGEFLRGLHRHGDKGAVKIVLAVKRLADAGPPKQEEKGHELRGTECKKLYELKPGDYRVIWFYGKEKTHEQTKEKERTIVVTHIFPKKGARYSRECAQGSSIMAEYWKEVQNVRT